jgi:hypothetical protein
MAKCQRPRGLVRRARHVWRIPLRGGSSPGVAAKASPELAPSGRGPGCLSGEASRAEHFAQARERPKRADIPLYRLE